MRSLSRPGTPPTRRGRWNPEYGGNLRTELLSPVLAGELPAGGNLPRIFEQPPFAMVVVVPELSLAAELLVAHV